MVGPVGLPGPSENAAVVGDRQQRFCLPAGFVAEIYRLARGQRNLCIRVRMPHGHGGAGENPGEILTFANSCLGRGAPLARVVKQGQSQNQVRAKFKSEFRIKRAELNFTRDAGKWQDRKWETVPAEIDQASRKVTARLPDGVKVYYLNLVDQREMVVSSEHVEITGTMDGLKGIKSLRRHFVENAGQDGVSFQD
jgi:hypothetical protein